MELLPGVSSHTVTTPRLTVHYLEAGPADGTPVVMVHGNLSTGRFYEHILSLAPPGLRVIAPDMRGFGDSEPLPLDATRGLRDWADDTRSLIETLGITSPVHLAGWSTGGGAIMQYLIDHPVDVASLTLIGTVSPYGFGGTAGSEGTPVNEHFSGSGGGSTNPDFVARLAAGDTSDESDASPRNVINAAYWHPSHRESPEREDMLLAEVLKSHIGDGGFPGDSEPCETWPGVAPGTRGILNALSGKHLNVSSIVDVDPKPPILWVRGADDAVVADESPWDMATLGKLGVIPGWPGDEIHPPQPMVAQTRAVLERYAAAGGTYREVVYEDSGHGAHIDHADDFSREFFAFVM